jgi:hypothetical protein
MGVRRVRNEVSVEVERALLGTSPFALLFILNYKIDFPRE